mmetsp:Transcript_24766/g.29172  ORF Transcript_24766/g.29172 Transcript_24766/m.29172 type:complete len:348 (+) Transcript_24766:3-1046(+)
MLEVMNALHLTGHLSKFPADHGMFDEFLPESGSLVREFPGIFDQASAQTARLHHKAPALVVEILHDDSEALVLLANEVLRRHFHRIEFDIGGAAWPNTLAVHPLRCNPGTLFQKEHGHTAHARTTGANGTSEVVRENTVGDPFLVAVHDVEVTLLLGHCLDGGHITSSIGLCDVQGDDLLPHEAIGGHALLHLVSSEVQHRRESNLQALDEAPQDSAAAAPGKLVHKDQLVEIIQVLGSIVGHQIEGTRVSAHHDGQETGLCALDVGLLGHRLVDLPLADEGNDVLIHKGPAALAPCLVGLLVISTVVGTVVPVGVAVRVAKAERLWSAHDVEPGLSLGAAALEPDG